ncbi:hypothetical protein [Streptomyces sp. NPDC060027]|uniref:hypothetical protein n=1 Tax=Streptomyces sp. NPDC060027 TaxID=3347040 RepID=UPI0036B92D83
MLLQQDRPDLLSGSRDLRSTLDLVVDYNARHPRRAQLYAMVQAEALDPAHPARAYFDGRSSYYAKTRWECTGTDVPAELLRVLPAAASHGTRVVMDVRPVIRWPQAPPLVPAVAPQRHSSRRAPGDA